MRSVERTEIDNVVVFPIEHTHFRTEIENNCWRQANKLSTDFPGIGRKVKRLFDHVPAEVLDEEFKRIQKYSGRRIKHYKKCAAIDTQSRVERKPTG